MFGKKCKPVSSGLLDEKKDRSDYFFDIELDKEKLKLVEAKTNQLIKEGYPITTWSENDQRLWKMGAFPAMKCGGYPRQKFQRDHEHPGEERKETWQRKRTNRDSN